MDDFIGWHGLTADSVVMLEKLVIAVGLLSRKTGFLCRDYYHHCTLSSKICYIKCWDSDICWLLHTCREKKSKLEKETAVPIEIALQKVRGMCMFHCSLQAHRYCLAIATVTKDSIIQQFTCCKSWNAKLDLVLFVFLHS